MQRLGLNEAAERLVDQGDVDSPEQMMDVFGRAQDNPVERQLEQPGARLNAARVARRRSARHLILKFLHDFHLPPGIRVCVS